MINLLEKMFGKRLDSTGLEFANIKSKEIAQMIGVDTGYLSRMLNPGVGESNKETSYTRINTKLRLLQKSREAEQLEKQLLNLKLQDDQYNDKIKSLKESVNRSRFLAFFLGIVALTFILQYWSSAGDNQNHQLILSSTEQQAVFDIYSTMVRYQLAYEAVVLNQSVKQGEFDNKPDLFAPIMTERCEGVIGQARFLLQATNLKNESGENLSDVYARSAQNDIRKNVESLAPVLTNKEAISGNIANFILKKVEAIQYRNFQLFDKDFKDRNKKKKPKFNQ